MDLSLGSVLIPLIYLLVLSLMPHCLDLALLLLFSCQVMSDSLEPHGPHQASPSFTISQSLPKFMSIESVMPSNHLILCYSLLLPSVFPRISNFFPMNWLFTSGGQSIGASASASVLPMSIQDWCPLRLTGLI